MKITIRGYPLPLPHVIFSDQPGWALYARWDDTELSPEEVADRMEELVMSTSPWSGPVEWVYVDRSGRLAADGVVYPEGVA